MSCFTGTDFETFLDRLNKNSKNFTQIIFHVSINSWSLQPVESPAHWTSFSSHFRYHAWNSIACIWYWHKLPCSIYLCLCCINLGLNWSFSLPVHQAKSHLMESIKKTGELQINQITSRRRKLVAISHYLRAHNGVTRVASVLSSGQTNHQSH